MPPPAEENIVVGAMDLARMDSSNLDESDDSSSEVQEVPRPADTDQEHEAVATGILANKRPGGRPVNQVWELFTDAIAAHSLTAGNNCICKHCKQAVRHHNKTNTVQMHLKNCRPFVTLMKNTAAVDRPEWFDSKVSKSQSISDAGSTRSSVQPSMMSYTVPKVTKKQLETLHEALAMHYYCTGTSFQRVQEYHLLKAFQAVNPSVTLPTRKKLAGPLLDICYTKVEIEVKKLLKCETQNLCITSDGWSNISNEAVVNYMAITPSTTLFLESVNTGEQGHSSDWIAADLQRVFDSHPFKVVGAVTNNTSANKKAWRILKENNPTLFFHGCISHGLHLIVKDIFAPTKRKPPGGGESVYPQGYPFEHLLNFSISCKEVVSFFHNHHAMKARLKSALNAAKVKTLEAPAPTRWGSLIRCFRSILAADVILNAIVNHRDFNSSGTTKQKEQKRIIKDFITSVNFIDYLKMSITILEPIDMFITKFQSDSVPISEVYQAFIELPKMISAFAGCPRDQKEYLIKLTAERLKFMYGDAHGFGNILDPRYLGDGMDREKRKEVEDLLFAFGNKNSIEQQEQMYNEYTQFRVCALQEKTADNFRFKMLMKETKSVRQYWVADGMDWPVLQKVALRVFSMACSSSASERNFSTFGFVHTKHRNRLSDAKVKKLVYVKTNGLQLLRQLQHAYESDDDEGDSVQEEEYELQEEEEEEEEEDELYMSD